MHHISVASSALAALLSLGRLAAAASSAAPSPATVTVRVEGLDADAACPDARSRPKRASRPSGSGSPAPRVAMPLTAPSAATGGHTGGTTTRCVTRGFAERPRFDASWSKRIRTPGLPRQRRVGRTRHLQRDYLLGLSRVTSRPRAAAAASRAPARRRAAVGLQLLATGAPAPLDAGPAAASVGDPVHVTSASSDGRPERRSRAPTVSARWRERDHRRRAATPR